MTPRPPASWACVSSASARNVSWRSRIRGLSATVIGSSVWARLVTGWNATRRFGPCRPGPPRVCAIADGTFSLCARSRPPLARPREACAVFASHACGRRRAAGRQSFLGWWSCGQRDGSRATWCARPPRAWVSVRGACGGGWLPAPTTRAGGSGGGRPRRRLRRSTARAGGRLRRGICCATRVCRCRLTPRSAVHLNAMSRQPSVRTPVTARTADGATRSIGAGSRRPATTCGRPITMSWTSRCCRCAVGGWCGRG